MRILIATVQVPFISSEAEVLSNTLLEACRARGHQAEIVAIPFNPSSRVLDQMLACRLYELSQIAGEEIDRLICLEFPAFLIPHPKKSLWVLHQQREFCDFWGAPLFHDPIPIAEGAQLRGAITNSYDQCLKESSVFAVSKNVARKLKQFNSIESKTLYPPPQNADRFFCAKESDHLFYPSRLNRFKRPELVLEALAKTRNPVKVIFGDKANPAGPHPSLKEGGSLASMTSLSSLVEKLNLTGRAVFLGQVSEDSKRKYYSEAIGVIYTPFDEDYADVPLEGMLSSKPIVTCSDSGGPLEFVRHQETGLVADPNPTSLAAVLDELWENRGLSEKLGKRGRELYHALGIHWDHVLGELLA